MMLVNVVAFLLLTAASLVVGALPDPHNKQCQIKAPNGQYLAPTLGGDKVQLSSEAFTWFVGPCGRIIGGIGLASLGQGVNCFAVTSALQQNRSYAKCDPSWKDDLERWVFTEHRDGKGYLLQSMVRKTCLRGDIQDLIGCEQAPSFQMECQSIGVE